MSSIDDKKFKEQFSKSGEPVIVINQDIDAKIEFAPEEWQCKYATIRNCKFERDFVLKGVDLRVGVKFVDCEFSKSLIVENCSALGFDRDFNFYGGSIIIEGGAVATLAIKESRKIDRGIRIVNETKIKDCHLYNLTTKSDGSGVHFENIEIQDKFDIHHLRLNGNLSIDSCIIKAWVRGWDNNMSSLSIAKSKFYNDFYFGGGKIKNISMRANEFHDDVAVVGVCNVKKLTTKDDEFKRSFAINYEEKTNTLYGGPSELYIQNTCVSSAMVINGAKYYIRKLNFICSPKSAGTFMFNSCNFEDTTIENENLNASLIFNYCEFGDLIFSHFFNYGSLTLSSCGASNRKDSKCVLYNSILGKTNLLNFLFNSFSKVEIHDSIFVDINVSGVDWFDDYKLSINPDAGIDLIKKREVYRQLKQVCERNGDKIQALTFRAKELSLFYQSMIQRRVPFFKGDRVSLWLSQSNGFGLDWIKAAVLLILVTVVFFPVIVIAASPDFLLVHSRNPVHIFLTVLELWNHSEVLPQLLNPTRILSRLFPSTELGFTAHFFDTVHRIILAYLIVQTIAAFRKYIR